MSSMCPYCGGQWLVEVLEVYVEERTFTIDTCCEGSYEEALEHLQHGDRRQLGRWLEEQTGLPCRQVVSDAEAGGQYGNGGIVVDFGLEQVPVTLAEAQAFIDEHHRHNAKPQGWLYGFGLRNGPELVAVATVGRPVARMLDDGTVAEVTRVCVPKLPSFLVWNACSMLYGAAAREAKTRGYARIITYTRAGEAATSIKACGWTPTHVTKIDRRGWDRKGRPRPQPRAPRCRKLRWERGLTKPARQDVVGRELAAAKVAAIIDEQPETTAA